MQIRLRVRQDVSQLAEQFEGDVTDGFNWGSLVPHVVDAVERMFRTEGDDRWDPLNDQYAAWKARHYPGAGLLVRTGTYFEAATTPGGAYNVVEVDNDSLTFGVEGLDYAAYHEEGRGHLPERPIFALLESDAELRERAIQELSDFITQKLTR